MADIYHLLARIELRPALYLGTLSISLLEAFVYGYEMALRDNRLPFGEEVPPFRQFHSWVNRRLGVSSNAGWARVLLEHCGSERSGLEMFFELLADFKKCVPIRQHRVVLGQHHFANKDLQRGKRGIGKSEVEVIPDPKPEGVTIIELTTDSGCYRYVWYYEEEYNQFNEEYYPSLQVAKEAALRNFGIKQDEWEVTDLPAPSTHEL